MFLYVLYILSIVILWRNSIIRFKRKSQAPGYSEPTLAPEINEALKSLGAEVELLQHNYNIAAQIFLHTFYINMIR